MDYAHLHLPIVEARVDWITCSAKRGARANGLIEFAERSMLGEQLYGDRFDEWRFQGYQGYQAGNVRWGWGKAGALVAMSKERSHLSAPDLALLADHWSRLDYCVTVFDVNQEINPSDDYWSIYLRRYPDRKSPLRLSRLQDFGQGQTISLGARTAATYLRCYDKYRESQGDYAAGCWRWELELKREQSEAEQKRWSEQIVFPAYIAGLVKCWPEMHHLPCPWHAESQLHPAHQLKVTRDADRTLAWLATQVAPSVEWVSQARGEKEVKRVLHLD